MPFFFLKVLTVWGGLPSHCGYSCYAFSPIFIQVWFVAVLYMLRCGWSEDVNVKCIEWRFKYEVKRGTSTQIEVWNGTFKLMVKVCIVKVRVGNL